MTRPHEERKKALEALCRLGEMFRRGEDDPRWRIETWRLSQAWQADDSLDLWDGGF